MKKQIILSLLVVFAVALFAPTAVSAFNNDVVIENVETKDKKADAKKADTKAEAKKSDSSTKAETTKSACCASAAKADCGTAKKADCGTK
jgi:hypothetical protein